MLQNMLRDPTVTSFALQSYEQKYQTMHLLFLKGLRESGQGKSSSWGLRLGFC